MTIHLLYSKLIKNTLLTIFSSFLMLSSLHASSEERKQVLDAMVKEITTQFKDVKHLTVVEAKKLKAVTIIDARGPEERQVSFIPESLTFSPDISIDPKLPVLIYCTIGYRSSLLAQKLSKDGFDAYNLKGGILNWAQSGGNLQSSKGQATRKVHTYGRLWDLLPDGYESVY